MMRALLTRWAQSRQPLSSPPTDPLPEMQYVTLGQTGFRVSVAGLGGGGHSRLGLSTGKSPASAISVVRQAIDWGINLIDTAEAYGSEAVIGQAIRPLDRDRLVLSTKKQPLDKRGQVVSPQVLQRSLERSLKALKTGYIDIYYLHGVKPQHYDSVVPMLMPTLEKLRDQGKIRFLGVTESFTRDPVHHMLTQALDDDCWDVMMVGFNCINQTAKIALLPKASEKGIGVLGMFAVRNALRSPETLTAAVKTLQAQDVLDTAMSPEIICSLFEHPLVVSVPDLAYRYCRHQSGIDGVMFGTGSLKHLHQNIASLLRPPLPDDITGSLDQIFSPVLTFTGN
ncbi:MAG: aldo/keto reductase [Cyanobacteria bacterium J06648_16]